MTTEQPKTGLVLLQNADALSDSDLGLLLDTLAGRPAVMAPVFTRWLVGWIKNELTRRVANESTDALLEADLPVFNASTWTNADLADAITVAFTLVQLTAEADGDRPALQVFTRKICEIVLAWARHRLRQ